MKVVHLSTYQEGGAGIAAMRLHRGLLRNGFDSSFLSLSGKCDEKENIFALEETIDTDTFDSNEKKRKRSAYVQAWKIRLQGKPVELFSSPFSPWKTEEQELIRNADIIHLHWVSGMIDIPRFLASVNKPIVWTMHDAWPFTGGFHYEQYFDKTQFKRSRKKSFAILQAAYSGKNITPVAPSKYMVELCRVSGIFSDRTIGHIPYGIRAESFSSSKKTDLYTAYDIPKGKKIWLFANTALDYFRKGSDLFFDALSSFRDENINFLIAGEKGNTIIPTDNRIKYIGNIRSEEQMALIIASSELVINTSREDNLPNILIESISCGTPVLSTACGGVPEIVNENLNGILVQELSAGKIAQVMSSVKERSFDRNAIMRDAQERFSENKQADRYIEIYRKL